MSYISVDLSSLLNLIQSSPSPSPSPTQTTTQTTQQTTTTSTSCAQGTCLDVLSCSSIGGTCASYCGSGCCCVSSTSTTPTQTAQTTQPSPSPSPSLTQTSSSTTSSGSYLSVDLSGLLSLLGAQPICPMGATPVSSPDVCIAQGGTIVGNSGTWICCQLPVQPTTTPTQSTTSTQILQPTTSIQPQCPSGSSCVPTISCTNCNGYCSSDGSMCCCQTTSPLPSPSPTATTQPQNSVVINRASTPVSVGVPPSGTSLPVYICSTLDYPITVTAYLQMAPQLASSPSTTVTIQPNSCGVATFTLTTRPQNILTGYVQVYDTNNNLLDELQVTVYPVCGVNEQCVSSSSCSNATAYGCNGVQTNACCPTQTQAPTSTPTQSVAPTQTPTPQINFTDLFDMMMMMLMMTLAISIIG